MNYNARTTAGAGMCPATQDLRESIKQDICSLINSSVPLALGAAYLNMSDPTQTCNAIVYACQDQFVLRCRACLCD